MSHIRQRFHNLSATAIIIAAGWMFYGLVPYYQQFFSQQTTLFNGWEIGHWQILQTATAGYALLLAIFYLTERAPRMSKSIWCLRALRRLLTSPGAVLRGGWSYEERLGLLTLLLKFFFAPLMLVWLVDHVIVMVNNGVGLTHQFGALSTRFLDVFNANGYWCLFQLILFLDVFFYTVGYLVELPGLKNEIRSVDPTWLGWGVALACYPPFNGLTNQVLGWHSTDFPQFGNPAVHLAANFCLLGLMGVYTWASVALNLRASNLTHRGIVASGPYRFIRHPAYVCKNLAWWIGLQPALWDALHSSPIAAVLIVGSMCGWSFIYALRALTEERHLRSVDDEYDRYRQRVKYRFIPGVI
ncbi:MAG TPA: isoprenylcysteine carboxylmethyltransferase family protein [Thiobacillaceae bacterium]|nr:isoprenylcysteine carboxylmethyltransferase family protein [Thiobacillaceae bacterium]